MLPERQTLSYEDGEVKLTKDDRPITFSWFRSRPATRRIWNRVSRWKMERCERAI